MSDTARGALALFHGMAAGWFLCGLLRVGEQGWWRAMSLALVINGLVSFWLMWRVRGTQ